MKKKLRNMKVALVVFVAIIIVAFGWNDFEDHYKMSKEIGYPLKL